MPKKKEHVEEVYMPFKDYFKKKKKIIIEEFKKGGKGKSRGHDKPEQQRLGNAVLHGDRNKR